MVRSPPVPAPLPFVVNDHDRDDAGNLGRMLDPYLLPFHAVLHVSLVCRRFCFLLCGRVLFFGLRTPPATPFPHVFSHEPSRPAAMCAACAPSSPGRWTSSAGRPSSPPRRPGSGAAQSRPTPPSPPRRNGGMGERGVSPAVTAGAAARVVATAARPLPRPLANAKNNRPRSPRRRWRSLARTTARGTSTGKGRRNNRSRGRSSGSGGGGNKLRPRIAFSPLGGNHRLPRSAAPVSEASGTRRERGWRWRWWTMMMMLRGGGERLVECRAWKGSRSTRMRRSCAGEGRSMFAPWRGEVGAVRAAGAGAGSGRHRRRGSRTATLRPCEHRGRRCNWLGSGLLVVVLVLVLEHPV